MQQPLFITFFAAHTPLNPTPDFLPQHFFKDCQRGLRRGRVGPPSFHNGNCWKEFLFPARNWFLREAFQEFEAQVWQQTGDRFFGQPRQKNGILRRPPIREREGNANRTPCNFGISETRTLSETKQTWEGTKGSDSTWSDASIATFRTRLEASSNCANMWHLLSEKMRRSGVGEGEEIAFLLILCSQVEGICWHKNVAVNLGNCFIG